MTASVLEFRPDSRAVDVDTLSMVELQVALYAARIPGVGEMSGSVIVWLVQTVQQQVQQLGIGLLRNVAALVEEANATDDGRLERELFPHHGYCVHAATVARYLWLALHPVTRTSPLDVAAVSARWNAALA